MPEPVGARVAIPTLLGGLFLLNALLCAPRWIVAGGMGPPWIALEAVFVVGVLALLPRRRWSVTLAGGVAGLAGLVAVVGFADAAARLSLARPLNLYLDTRLARSVAHLLTGTMGLPRAVLLGAGATLGALVVVGALAYLLSRAPAAPDGRASRIAGVALVVLFTAGLVGGRVPALGGHLGLPVVELAREQARYLSRMLEERERFAEEMEAAPAGYGDIPGLLGRLEGRTVLLAFVESYGISALDDPRYSPVIQPRLDDLERRAEAAGLHLATGALVAPSQGGQSWLGHGTLLSGLWLDNQFRYELLLASDRETMVDDFRRAGYRTAALVPAITLAWPEGERLGYDQIFAHRDIDYRGPPLNWVTMPDQFTWSFLERAIRGEPDPRPLFAEVALISSHAPWTPILPVLDDWDRIGDGSIFAPWGDAGDTPEELWRDLDRVREHFALSVDYALHAMTAYAERFLDERTLLIVLGDHQPAPLITGEGASRDVPIHVLTGEPGLLDPFLEWGFAPGARPDPDRPAPRMSEFRHWFVQAFSDNPF